MSFNALWYRHNFGNFLLSDIDGEILEILVKRLVALYFQFIEENFSNFFLNSYKFRDFYIVKP